ncbi:cation diffusion facilitator family transporter [Roseivivax marinus]|jgi:cation diffusion facilitator family transporter|uniref:Cation diffusion facilitator family transporter n=1 Tax=Roseivivax marinus TaxID=1379903 RepID=W4HI40_9RHOB|nr:cation diffusion facilitator family transporter [Roseivivax marinus]ETW11670.1 cation diffusion facilitator family transporter [Roseivivax marinus]UMA65559.1 cation diffusion facilitator family transporter [Roseivivax marinus]SEL44743.1 cation diffusion facilitator family transporter [Roseivivax marinus]
MPERTRIAAASIGVGLAVLGIKTLAWWMTGSVALLSDALESIVNVGTAVAALAAVRVAERPPDAEHPYGHDKAEFLAAVAEGVLIVLAALFILREAWHGLINPEPIRAAWAGIGVNLVAGVLNGVWATVLIRRGRRLRAPALVADGRHLWADVVTSVGVASGVVLGVLTGLTWFDPLLAGCVALYILYSGWGVLSASASSLMDESVPEHELADLRAIISDTGQGAVQAHDLRTRHAGRTVFVEFHLVVPSDMAVSDAHEICDRIETGLIDALGECSVTIHVEPEEKAKRGAIVMS